MRRLGRGKDRKILPIATILLACLKRAGRRAGTNLVAVRRVLLMAGAGADPGPATPPRVTSPNGVQHAGGVTITIPPTTDERIADLDATIEYLSGKLEQWHPDLQEENRQELAAALAALDRLLDEQEVAAPPPGGLWGPSIASRYPARCAPARSSITRGYSRIGEILMGHI